MTLNQLVFATNNANKVAEINKLLGGQFNISTLKEAGIDIDIPEPFDSLEENADTKAQTIFQLTGKNCFSEDTGLFVDALNGAPGVLSARYAGEPANNIANIEKLLRLLGDNEQRNARFRTIIALIIDGKSMQFEGICEGKIIHTPKGEKGFGYDAIFVPDGSNSTFAEMEMEEKNRFSHRKKAVAQLIAFLNRAQ